VKPFSGFHSQINLAAKMGKRLDATQIDLLTRCI
jgi:hypothetical protein